jgi:hypothetical protein
MKTEELKKKYREILSTESGENRLTQLRTLLQESIKHLSIVHVAYFFCELLQSVDGLTDSEYDLLFGQVMDHLYRSATPQIIFLSAIDLEFSLALSRCPYEIISQSYYSQLIAWLENDMKNAGNYHSSVISICIGLSNMPRKEWGEGILKRLYEATIKEIKNHSERLALLEEILRTLNQWDVSSDLVVQVKKHLNAIRT